MKMKQRGSEMEPAHQVEIISLLELTNSIEGPGARRSTLRGEPRNVFFRGLNRFRLALLQQRQHLLATSPRPKFDFQVAKVFDICPDCLKSKEIDGTMEGATDKSDERFTEGSLIKTEKKRPS